MITLADAKLHLRLIDDIASADDYTAEDALIQALIGAAYHHAEQRTRVAFANRTETLVLDGFPPSDQAIELPWVPVLSVDSLDFIAQDGGSQSLDVAQLRLDGRSLYPLLAPQWGSLWPDTIYEPESVTITATVGYDATPPDVRAAILLMVGHLYENREAAIIGTISSELPLGVEMLLAPHVIHSVG